MPDPTVRLTLRSDTSRMPEGRDVPFEQRLKRALKILLRVCGLRETSAPVLEDGRFEELQAAALVVVEDAEGYVRRHGPLPSHLVAHVERLRKAASPKEATPP